MALRPASAEQAGSQRTRRRRTPAKPSPAAATPHNAKMLGSGTAWKVITPLVPAFSEKDAGESPVELTDWPGTVMVPEIFVPET